MSKMTPQIRFQGFTDDWEERKLGYILSERNDQMPETNEYPLMSFVQGKGVTPKGERYNRSFLVKDSEKKYKKTELGDFIYSSNNLETGSIGFNRTGKAVISPVYSIFKSKKSRESQFIGIMSGRKDFISKMVRFRQGVVYGQWRIHESDFLNIDMKMPNDKEQQLIISFFENIDKTITLHQRMLDLLKKQKKGFLQKMFPKNGAKVPELRFSGFADDWEERKLEKVIDVKSGKDYKHLNEGTVPVYGTGGYMLSVDQALSDVDAIGIGRKGTIDKPYLLRSPFWTVDTLFFAVPKPKIDLQFSLSIFKKINWKKFDESTGVPSLSKAVINSVSVSVPSYEEQQKIGSFFKQLDETIALHQRKLDLLKKQKKGFLQKMFVS
ncbi:restriction endonuclease subunit S [Leuconostoc mesenteroides]|uniref:restriction endonuclease subunit S n=1 Tax=Leuconostoc mesenteroides TaxID=1245 RepID=UPI001144DA7B|nr:restriction endonuclease subunit S [Leuconostoc mesenteroides]GEA92026.1 hypothetical protein LME01_17620 [Leuconostoc mesenteroides subsp. mesenteroides]